MPNKTDPILVRITPRPDRSPGMDDPDEVPSIRRLDCRNYDGCLDIAIENRWPGFTWNGCPGYQQQTPAEARHDYFATLNFLAETQLLQQLRVATFRTDSLADDPGAPKLTLSGAAKLTHPPTVPGRQAGASDWRVLRMEEVYVVRHKVLVEGVAVRQVARELGIARNTVRRYLRGAPPGVGQPRGRRGKPTVDKVRARALAILEDSPRWTGGKQRLTAARLHQMLIVEGFTVGETVVKELVREWKRQRREVFVPLVYRAGDLAEVDFFEVLVDIAGQRRKAHMFVMRLMHSGRDFAWLYPRQDQTCFLDGHVRAFAHFGGVPQRLAYDNLKAAVAKHLAGSERELASRFLALTTHYLCEASFARPRTGHDKGGVEARGKGIRWQELVPIPSGPDLPTVSRALLARLDARSGEVRGADGRSIADRFADERPKLLPLPPAPFEAAAFRSTGVSRRSLVKLEGAVYSVWSTWAELDVRAYVGVDEVAIVGPDGERVVHARQPFGGRSVDYRHYVRELARKPQALRQVADELVPALGAPFDQVWRVLVDERGPKQAARVFAQVLRALEQLGERLVRERLRAALASGELIALAMRPAAAKPAAVPVEQLPAALAGVNVAAGCAADYDTLLGGAS